LTTGVIWVVSRRRVRGVSNAERRVQQLLQWPAIAGMVAVGLLSLAAAVRLSRGRAAQSHA
jgi:hypothetical protein